MSANQIQHAQVVKSEFKEGFSDSRALTFDCYSLIYVNNILFLAT